MDDFFTTKSKFLSLVLRHRPAHIGISLDAQGWTSVVALLAAAQAHGVVLTLEELRTIVAQSDKQRFALSTDGTRIRANQGHSVQVDLGLMPCAPPNVLYHGTVAAYLEGIRRDGLAKGRRHHVHLSPDRATATAVGSRRDTPVIIEIQAGRMLQQGHHFFCSENGVWLTDHVPAKYLVFQ